MKNTTTNNTVLAAFAAFQNTNTTSTLTDALAAAKLAMRRQSIENAINAGHPITFRTNEHMSNPELFVRKKLWGRVDATMPPCNTHIMVVDNLGTSWLVEIDKIECIHPKSKIHMAHAAA